MIIKAKFIGRDSLGYVHGETYELLLNEVLGTSIRRVDGSGVCAYQSLSAFLSNWTDIKTELVLSDKLTTNEKD